MAEVAAARCLRYLESLAVAMTAPAADVMGQVAKKEREPAIQLLSVQGWA